METGRHKVDGNGWYLLKLDHQRKIGALNLHVYAETLTKGSITNTGTADRMICWFRRDMNILMYDIINLCSEMTLLWYCHRALEVVWRSTAFTRVIREKLMCPSAPFLQNVLWIWSVGVFFFFFDNAVWGKEGGCHVACFLGWINFWGISAFYVSNICVPCMGIFGVEK